jgi:hypothetical protein
MKEFKRPRVAPITLVAGLCDGNGPPPPPIFVTADSKGLTTADAVSVDSAGF